MKSMHQNYQILAADNNKQQQQQPDANATHATGAGKFDRTKMFENVIHLSLGTVGDSSLIHYT